MPSATPTSLLIPGKTCWRIAEAERFAVIVDGADYFVHVRKAILSAKHSVLMIGWDFDTRIDLIPAGEADDGAPEKLGDFLTHVVDTNPDLHIHLLKWDLGVLKVFSRGTTPLIALGWMAKNRITFKLDGAHPSGSSHHQKIVVIDDQLAFCGGIDITEGRWDTRQHLDEDTRRNQPSGKGQFGPWHDITTAVQGPAAKALGDLARDRWERATGDRLDPPPPVGPYWPEELDPMLTGAEVAISRTLPEYGEHKQVSEIEALYLSVIAATERMLYIESQYFASRRIAEAIIARLAEPDPPEFVIVNPETADGWLEEQVMGAARAKLWDIVRRADTKGRFRIYHPVTQNGNAIYVHAKVLVMDDRLVRIGSSNLNNRSMGFDTECDLSIEAGQQGEAAEATRHRIAALRDDLLAEHLGSTPAAVAAAIAREDGSLIAAIEGLRGPGRSLVPYEQPDFGESAKELFEGNELLDPERPGDDWRPFALKDILPG